MNKRFVFLIVFLLLCYSPFNYSQVDSGWQWLHPKPQGCNLLWCRYWDANTIYAAGWNGLFMKTNDAGNSWFVTNKAGALDYFPASGTPFRADVIDMHFFNMTTGISSCGYRLMKTTNAGLTFDSIPGTYIGNTLWNHLYFINNTTGYVVGFRQGKLLAKTTDGGNTWSFNTTIPSSYYYDIFSPDENLILALGYDFSGNASMSRSTDGGLSWNFANIGPGPLKRMKFINHDTGFVSGALGTVMLTTDGGMNWTPVNNGLPNSNNYLDIDTRNIGSVNEVYVTGAPNFIYKSANLGGNWEAVEFLGNGQLYTYEYKCTDLGGGDTLVTVGIDGAINKRFSQANRVLYTEYAKFFGNSFDLWVENANGKIWSVGSPTELNAFNQIIFSSNGGADWIVQPVANDETFHSINMINTSTGYVCGTAGTVLKTTNGGLNWNPVTSAASLDIRKVDFVNENTGWVFGIGGFIYKTTDGGMNWIQQTSGVTRNIYGADMFNANTGWIAIGDGSQVYPARVRKTTDGGNNWADQNSNSGTGAMFDIKMLNENTGYLGGFRALCKTTNGGINWDPLSVPVLDFQVQSMDFLDDMKGVIYNGLWSCLLSTTNGGVNWDVIDIETIAVIHPAGYNKIKLISGYVYITVLNSGIKRDSIGALSIGVFSWQNNIPRKYELYQNYPNPFNPVTTIKFEIPKPGSVTLKVYDITGREVRTIINNMGLNRGTITHQFDGTNLASGIYFYSLIVGGEMIDSKKMILVK